ncbi:MAG: redoxin domain-containing protein [Akkermansiaceae bacterium]|nr:redoxin domain-containing protein [Armatimonadota bacterium]
MNRTASVMACISLLGAAPSATLAQADTTVPAASTPVPTVDPAAMAILQKSQDKMFSLKTLRAECWETTTFPTNTKGKTRPRSRAMAVLTAAKPNLMRYDKWEMTAPDGANAYTAWKRNKTVPTYTFVNNGKNVWMQFGSSYRKNTNTGPDYMHTILEPWDGFYTTNSSPFSRLEYNQKQGDLLNLRLEGAETVDGIVCDVIHYQSKAEYGGETQEHDSRLFVGRDGIVRRKTDTIRFGGKPGYSRDAVIRNIVTNAPIKTPKTTFAYTPPKGVKMETPAPASQAAAEPALLASGTPAPDFSATDAGGTAVKLSDLRGKVVVVDFWASWCPPCVASMPHNQKVIKKLQDEGLPVVLLAVDNAEEQGAFAGWVKKHPEFDALRFVYADRKTSDISNKLYRVSGIPTQYIVDASGVIRSSSVGFGGETDDMEKAIRAALAAKTE